jgi:predicted transcriptional regulator
MTTKVLTAHIPLPLAEKVDQFATHMERSRAWIITASIILMDRPRRGASATDYRSNG